jgi:DNA invertase Pin-like site-specific DNA recombinase
MFTVIGTTVTSEREMMLERQREGIAKAKRRANTKGENNRDGHERWDRHVEG